MAVTGAPAAGPAAPDGEERRADPPRRRLVRIVAAVAAALALVGCLAAIDGWLAWREVDRLHLEPVGEDAASTYLLVGSDRRVDGSGPSGGRADALVIVRVDGDGTVAATVPRDLLVSFPDGSRNRIALAWDRDPQLLLDLVCGELGVGVDHVVEVDLGGLPELVDLAGGVVIEVPAPLRDGWTGVDLEAGPVRLHGAEALAYARTRRALVRRGGAWEVEHDPEAARRRRAGAVLAALGDGLAPDWRDPLGAHRLAWTAGESLRVDDGMSAIDALELVGALAWVAGDPDGRLDHLAASVTDGAVPVASLLPEAQPLLAELGGGPGRCEPRSAR